jgi:hypothetical protein
MDKFLVRHPEGDSVRTRAQVGGGWRRVACTCLPIDLAPWRQLCEWLEAKPYNASYKGPGQPLGELLGMGKVQVDERRRVRLVFWSSGHGWRLHKNWQERLAELEREADRG